VRQILRMIVAVFAVAALTGGGAVAFADHGPGGSSGGEGGDGGHKEHGGHHDAGDHTAAADVYTLAEPQHGNPEGVAFDKRSGFFFVSATGDGSIYRGRLGDTATPVPVFIPGAAGQSATGLKVQRGKLYAAGAATGTIKVYDAQSGALLATFDTKGGDSSPTFVNDLDVTQRGDVYATDSKRPAIYHLTAEEIAAGTPAPKPIDPADVISTSPEIPFNASPSAFNLNGIVVDDDRGDDQGRHRGDRHATRAIGAPTSSSWSTRTPGSSSASRSARTATPRADPRGRGQEPRPVHRRRRPAHRPWRPARRAGLQPRRRLPQRRRELPRPAQRRAQGQARGPAHRRLLPGAVDHRPGS